MVKARIVLIIMLGAIFLLCSGGIYFQYLHLPAAAAINSSAESAGADSTCLPVSTVVSSSVSTWVQYFPQSAPSARSYHTMIYDELQNNVVLFGGVDDQTRLGDTWVWDGAEWQQLAPADSPAARAGHAFTYDSFHHVGILNGGHDGTSFPADTWAWDGTNWTRFNTTLVSPGPTGHSLAFDETHLETIFFGGFGANFMNQTWRWDGAEWHQLFPVTSPDARGNGGMVYDEVNAKILLFGGYNPGLLSDTWLWDGSTWQEVYPGTSPEARSYFDLVYDSLRKRALIFGGQGEAIRLNDTWEWDGVNWRENLPHFSTCSPPPRHGLRLAAPGSLPIRRRYLYRNGKRQLGLPHPGSFCLAGKTARPTWGQRTGILENCGQQAARPAHSFRPAGRASSGNCLWRMGYSQHYHDDTIYRQPGNRSTKLPHSGYC